MSEQTTDTPQMTEAEEYKLKEELKAQATQYGIPFGPNSGIKALKEKIAEYKANNPDWNKKEALSANAVRVPVPESEYLAPHVIKERHIKKLSRLVRVRITCMNAAKTAWQGEIFTFANNNLTLRRMVPFKQETHVEEGILQVIRERKYRPPIQTKKKTTTNARAASMLPEFAIEVLPPLSQDELKGLAEQQLAAEG